MDRTHTSHPARLATERAAPRFGSLGRRWLKWGLSLVAALLCGPAFASFESGMYIDDVGGPSQTAPWDAPIIASLSDFPFMPDRAFNGGHYVTDAFFANSNAANNYFEGKKIVVLDNGDLVVAALVKKPDANQSNGFWNLGLVRYNRTGTARQVWSNPTAAYSHISGQYIVYPNSATATYNYIRDIKAIGGKLIVYANRSYQGGPDVDVDLLVFGEDGSFQSVTTAFASTAAEYAEGIEVYSAGTIGFTNYVLALATQFVPDGRPAFKRFSISAAGFLTQENPDMNAVNVRCTTAGQQCFGRGIALGQPSMQGETPSIYVVTEFRPDATTVDGSFVVTKVNSNGVKSPNWDPGNINWHASNSGDRHDWPIGIVVQTGIGTASPPDAIFVGVNIGQNCKDGISVVRFSSADNGVSPSLTRFGGSNATGSLCSVISSTVASDNATSMARHGTTIALAGYRFIANASSDSAMYAVDANLTVLDQRAFPFPIGGPRQRESLLSGITAVGGLKFAAAGYAAYPGGTIPATLVGKTHVAIIQFAPDRIFGHGFDF